MTRIKFMVLLVLALAALAFAGWMSQHRAQSGDLYSGPLLPGLSEQINQVTGLVLRDSQGRQVSIRLNDGFWGIEEKQGYPADAGKLRSALLILADAQVLEVKTSRPDMYSRLGVEDPDTPGADNLVLTIVLPGQERSLIMGKLAMNSGTYVRRNGEPTSLLINQALALQADPIKWLTADLLDLGPDVIQRVDIRHPDGSELVITRKDGDGHDFRIEDLPPGREPQSDFVANGIAGALARLSFQDVRRLRQPDAGTAIQSRFITRKGLVIDLSLQRNEQPWASFAFSLAEGADQTQEALVQDYSQRLAGWEYVLAGPSAEQLGKRMEDLLKPAGS
ncbi:MAG: DUF4340 domain-containing protein [Gammaproteobacteria bacterium]|nr:DUF4340 domain-containing protein [Gammaproteobacteria bacterium]